MTKEYILKSPEDSIKFAKMIADLVEFGDILALRGDLGTGKTFFSQAFSKHLGVDEQVSSPSYVLLNEYTSKKFKISHFDLYRLNDQEEVFEIGIPEIFEDGITLIEWPDILGNLLPKNSIKINFEYYKDGRKVFVNSEKKEFIKKLK
ncbi:MAG: tRNA (adenosine(37)-N6)-threonylcarbamoyltransferase complex ATPase subunit type 1 TsaE [Candidatus Cloacimonadota bacterium]|nr:tRNA (adenosine(37)-N6)-threonylcarbamoyltransferase complex ATPase subunit type 1 TsaE [Candidatus Cloacimonadota bacterium]